MPKLTGTESPSTRKLLVDLRKKKEVFYKDLARYISRPTRNAISVNVTKLARFDDDVVVPGSVLGTGNTKKAGKVYALRFSKSARTKIVKAGGKCMPLSDLIKSDKKARIVI